MFKGIKFKKRRKRKTKKELARRRAILIFILCCFLSFLCLMIKNCFFDQWNDGITDHTNHLEKPQITEDYLTKNSYSRPGIKLKKVKGIVIHYVANPGSQAIDNRNYFENLKNTHKTKASSHFIVGLEGEIIQCIPLDEISYASNDRNKDTISIECCHPKKDGKFNEKTYASVVDLTAWLVEEYGLEVEDVIRHYDVTGKKCPLYYVKHEDAWHNFLQDVANKK